MRNSTYSYRGYRITIRTELLFQGLWRGHATIERIPTAESRVEIQETISPSLEFETQGMAYREIKKLAEHQVDNSLI